MIGLRMKNIQANIKNAIAGLEMEKDMHNSTSIKKALTHVLTADMWVSREAAHQEARSENSKTGP